MYYHHHLLSISESELNLMISKYAREKECFLQVFKNFFFPGIIIFIPSRSPLTNNIFTHFSSIQFISGYSSLSTPTSTLYQSSFLLLVMFFLSFWRGENYWFIEWKCIILGFLFLWLTPESRLNRWINFNFYL